MENVFGEISRLLGKGHLVLTGTYLLREKPTRRNGEERGKKYDKGRCKHIIATGSDEDPQLFEVVESKDLLGFPDGAESTIPRIANKGDTVAIAVEPFAYNAGQSKEAVLMYRLLECIVTNPAIPQPKPAKVG